MKPAPEYHHPTNYNQDPYYDTHHDPYFRQKHLPEGAICNGCGAAVVKGRFRWPSAPVKGAGTVECPACARVRENVPGGIVSIKGSFVGGHRDEIMNLIKNVEASEMEEHPLQRLVAIESAEGGLDVTTTYEHLAHRLGTALANAYQGSLKVQFAKDEKFVRIEWMRD